MDTISISLKENPTSGISEIRIDGEINTLTASKLEDVIDTLIKREQYKLIIDLAGVEYISSAGWGIFFSHINDVHNHDGDIKLTNMIPNVYEIYELLECDSVLKAYSNNDEARNDFSGDSAPVVKKKSQQ
jgi:anti-sigma B factor antagonist